MDKLKENMKEKELAKRRFCEKVDGPMVMKYYAKMPTAVLAERMGLTVKQIKNYVYNQLLCRRKPRVAFSS